MRTSRTPLPLGIIRFLIYSVAVTALATCLACSGLFRDDPLFDGVDTSSPESMRDHKFDFVTEDGDTIKLTMMEFIVLMDSLFTVEAMTHPDTVVYEGTAHGDTMYDATFTRIEVEESPFAALMDLDVDLLFKSGLGVYALVSQSAGEASKRLGGIGLEWSMSREPGPDIGLRGYLSDAHISSGDPATEGVTNDWEVGAEVFVRWYYEAGGPFALVYPAAGLCVSKLNWDYTNPEEGQKAGDGMHGASLYIALGTILDGAGRSEYEIELQVGYSVYGYDTKNGYPNDVTPDAAYLQLIFGVIFPLD